MALVTYEETRPWAKAIRDEVLARRMPPWGAVKGVGDFRDDPSLSQPEIDLLVSWVEGGAPEGDAIYMPRAASFNPTGAAEPESVPFAVTGGTVHEIGAATKLVGIRADKLPDKASLEVYAQRPDGSVERLIWIREYPAKFHPAYWFREPVTLAAGSRIAVYADAPAGAIILAASPER